VTATRTEPKPLRVLALMLALISRLRDNASGDPHRLHAGQVTMCGAGLISRHLTDRLEAHEPASPGLLGSGVVAGLGNQGLPAAAVRDRDRDPFAEGPPCWGKRLAVAGVDQLADPLR
jgi:hypothetical protein